MSNPTPILASLLDATLPDYAALVAENARLREAEGNYLGALRTANATIARLERENASPTEWGRLQEHSASSACRNVEAALIRESALREALEKIERWFGEFPPSGRYWRGGEPMSYAAAFGSNGERDFMRDVARRALAATAPEDAR